MKMKKKIFAISILFLIIFPSRIRADEGMWIPMLIEKYNIRLMQEKGFKLSAEDIYSVNKACMKDAVLLFGGGCTGEIISGQGLLITNHHCGRGNIQQLSSLEHDYIANGYWALSQGEELPCPGLSITILKRMEDVTEKVLSGVNDNTPAEDRQTIISSNIAKVQSDAVAGTHYRASVRPFFMGNQYFLFVNETFRDVRFVGAPPATIGNFGSETDNWIWPRHTGDFSLFRIYADKSNNPSDFSKENVPYKPAYFFPISLKGVKEGDFTMVFGYPGSTVEYVPSYYIDMVSNYINPKIIDIRTRKIEIMEAAMNTDPLIRLQYFVKKSGIANSWKKWQGEILGLKKMGTIGKKQQYEEKFTQWVDSDQSRREKYANLLPLYRDLYSKMKTYRLVSDYTSEVFSGAEVFRIAKSMGSLAALYSENASSEEIGKAKDNLVAFANGFFKNYNAIVDRKLFEAVMTMYGENIETQWLVPEYLSYKNRVKGNFSGSAEKLFARSPFTDENKFKEYVKGFNKSAASKLKNDLFYSLASASENFINEKVSGELMKMNIQVQELNRLYMRAQMEFEPEKAFYPDANLTLRVAYGNVSGYKAKDAVLYENSTTLNGIMEKDNPEIIDYDVPDKLKELWKNKDYGRYAENGDVHVCFIANNHTTGGNSGSPVINAEGQLIGVNFDRAWEGVASDMQYNPGQSRNISLDIRYALFIIDKFAGAGYLLDEMKLIQ